MSNRNRYIIAPLFFLLLLIVIINLFSGATLSDQGLATAVSTQPTIAPSITRPPILPATILPSPTPMPSPQPTTSAGNITLLGPPPDSTFLQNGQGTPQVAFFWSYSQPLQNRQRFVLTLQQNENSFVAGTLEQSNLGKNYQLIVNLADLPARADTAVWQIHLEWVETSIRIHSSKARSLNFASP